MFKIRGYTISELLKKPFVRYLIVGGITYIFDISVLVGMFYGLSTTRALAASASFWLGLLFSFLMQKLIAFQDFQKELKTISRQAVGYGVLVAVNYFVTVLVVDLFPGKYIIFSRTLALIITTIWNYVIYKYIFKKSK